MEEDEHQVEEDEHQMEEDEVVWVYACVFILLFIHYSKTLKLILLNLYIIVLG